MKNLIASRIGSYGKYQDRGWSHLPEIGIHHVEVNAPNTAEEADALERLTKTNNVRVSSFQGKCDVRSDEILEETRRLGELCKRFNTRYLFVSCKAEDEPREKVWRRLRAAGDIAAEYNFTIVMETHPDLITNGTVALETMQAVDHPNVRVNFDTANVYYYNHDVTTMSELETIIDYVAAVHLKDTDGGFKSANFPKLGAGIVDFPAVFKRLGSRGFAGPYTMELEGPLMSGFDETQQLAWVADSVSHLRSIGAM